jgi:hypothetical protein
VLTFLAQWRRNSEALVLGICLQSEQVRLSLTCFSSPAVVE